MFVPVSSPRASLFPPCAFPVFVCLCHVPSCCCPCLHPSPFPNLPVCLYYWFHLCPVNSPCLVHLCLCLPPLDCSHLSLVICCLCVYIVLVSRCVFVNCCYVVCSLFLPLFRVFLAFSASALLKCLLVLLTSACPTTILLPIRFCLQFLDCLPVY